MKSIRIIPRLDIKGPHLVKGMHLEGLRVLGTPADFAKYYYEHGADELLYADVVASLYERNSLNEIISNTAREIFIPLTVGGGLRTLDDIKSALRSGADKVSINTAAVRNPEFIKEAAQRYGSSTIVVAIEAIQQPDGSYKIFTDNGREPTGIEVVEWAQKVAAYGAGELIITAVDKDGTGRGYDLNLIQQVADAVNIPVIAHGGAGKIDDIEKLIKTTNIDAVCIASMLHYDCVSNNKTNVDISEEGNIDYLKSGKVPGNIHCMGIGEIKTALKERGIICR